MLDQYLRLNTYYNLPSSCIVYCIVNIISEWKQSLPLSFILILCDIIDTPECVSMTLTWRLSSLTVPQLPPMFGWRWHRGRPLTSHPMSSRLTGEKAKESFLTCHAFLMRLAKKLWWKVLKLQQWKTKSLMDVASWSQSLNILCTNIQNGKYFMKVSSGLCNSSPLNNAASWLLTWIYRPQPKKLITFISRLFLAAVSPVFQKTFYGSLGKLFFCLLRCQIWQAFSVTMMLT